MDDRFILYALFLDKKSQKWRTNFIFDVIKNREQIIYMNIFKFIKSLFTDNNIPKRLDFLSKAIEEDNHELIIKYCYSIKKLLNKENSEKNLIEYISFVLANSLSKTNKLDDAEKEIQIAYSINPKNESYLLNYSWIKMDKEEFEKAIEFLNIAISLNPENSEGYFYRGICYGKLNIFTKALADFEKSILISPESDSYYNIGYVYHRMKDYSNAIEYFNNAININPIYASAYVARGNSRIKLGQKELACRDFHRALELGEKRVQENIDEFCCK